LRFIKKGKEPKTLKDYRDTPDCNYIGYSDHGELKLSLVTEQRGLCCYCMSRIKKDSVKVEHWRCRDNFPDKQLDYRNMLGVCYGGERERMDPALYHCDKTKGNLNLKYNPANPAHRIESRLYYEPDGNIRSYDEEFNKQLESVLNLNQKYLKKNRESVFSAFSDWLDDQKKKKYTITRDRFERECRWRVGGTEQLEPNCQVAVWILEQRLASTRP